MADKPITENKPEDNEALKIAENAIRLYSELIETVIGVSVDYHPQSGGPEARIMIDIDRPFMEENEITFIEWNEMSEDEREFVCAPVRGVYTNYKSLSEKIEKFVTDTEGTIEEIEKLMQVAMIEEARDSRYYSPWQALDLVEGCGLQIEYGNKYV